jgi:hypothetical protein
MLVLVLVLVLAAAALLVTSLVTSLMLWAWLSVGVSVLAAIALLLDWARRRGAAWAGSPVPAAPPDRPEQPPEPVAAPEPAPTDADGDREPAEEDTDAADLLLVAELTVRVRVVDERPRYHLAACRWLAGRPTLGLPVREARELGFTPCAVCTPDAMLAQAHRTAGAG